jgi:hypothetical protein
VAFDACALIAVAFDLLPTFVAATSRTKTAVTRRRSREHVLPAISSAQKSGFAAEQIGGQPVTFTSVDVRAAPA